jgi:hypothetical protein
MRYHRIAPLLALALTVALYMAPPSPATLGAPREALRTLAQDGPLVPAMYLIRGVRTGEERTAISRTGADLILAGPGRVLVRATPAQHERLERLGFAPLAHPLPQDFPEQNAGYHNDAELRQVVGEAAARHPDIVAPFSIGASFENRGILAVKISDNVHVDEQEPEALFIGLHHAREHLTVEMTLYLLRLLTEEYGLSADVTALVDTREIFIVLALNPDGGEYDIAAGSYRYWRKNRQRLDGEAVGIDLNRNYGYRWGCCGGSDDVPWGDLYRGDAPFAAPEVARLRDFVQSRVVGGEQQISVSIDFHTAGEVILWPYGYTYEDIPPDMAPDDQHVFAELARAMAGRNGYHAMQSSDLYITDGSYIDWAYGAHGIFAFTFELYPPALDFYPPDEVIPAETARNREAVLLLLQQADCPYRVIWQEEHYCPALATHTHHTYAPLVARP